jgi:hypothetical protein
MSTIFVFWREMITEGARTPKPEKASPEIKNRKVAKTRI